MLNAIDTMLEASLEFLKRGLAGIRNIVRATLLTYKGSSEPGILTGIDLDDLPFLAKHESDARHLCLEWDNRISEPLSRDVPAVRLITLNLLLNACPPRRMAVWSPSLPLTAPPSCRSQPAIVVLDYPKKWPLCSIKMHLLLRPRRRAKISDSGPPATWSAVSADASSSNTPASARVFS